MAKHNKNYCGKPDLPKYKNKKGRQVVFFDYTQGTMKDGKYYFPRKDRKNVEYIEINIERDKFKLLRIVHYGSCYKIELVYEKEIPEKISYNDNYVSIDLGVNNLATLTNNIGIQPIIINGRILKSINQYYNKLQAKAMSYVSKGSSNRIQRIRAKRNNIVENHMHKVSRYIIKYCIENNLDNIIIGRNENWQRGSNIGAKNNQAFVQIPFENLIKKFNTKQKRTELEFRLFLKNTRVNRAS